MRHFAGRAILGVQQKNFRARPQPLCCEEGQASRPCGFSDCVMPLTRRQARHAAALPLGALHAIDEDNLCQVLQHMPLSSLAALSQTSKAYARLIQREITAHASNPLRVRVLGEEDTGRRHWGGEQAWSGNECCVAYLLPVRTALSVLLSLERLLDLSGAGKDSGVAGPCGYGELAPNMPRALLALQSAILPSQSDLGDAAFTCPDCWRPGQLKLSRPANTVDKAFASWTRCHSFDEFGQPDRPTPPLHSFECGCGCSVALFDCVGCSNRDMLYSDGCTTPGPRSGYKSCSMMKEHLSFELRGGPDIPGPWCSTCFEYVRCGICAGVEHSCCMPACVDCGKCVCWSTWENHCAPRRLGEKGIRCAKCCPDDE